MGEEEEEEEEEEAHSKFANDHSLPLGTHSEGKHRLHTQAGDKIIEPHRRKAEPVRT